jgi:hypothetical protein
MTTLSDWAARWIPPAQLPAALADLQRTIVPPSPDLPSNLTSEAGAQVAVRLEASRRGDVLWRHNVGALPDANGRWLRFGLANDTPAMNLKIKLGDLIGIKTHVVTLADLGKTHGLFYMREVKKPGWKWPRTPTAREVAQRAGIELVLSRGGDAAFTTGQL